MDKFKLEFPKPKEGQDKSKSMGNGNLTIEHMDVNDKKIYICVFRNSIGKTLYSGTIHVNSKFRKLEEKPQKQQFKIQLMVKDKEKGFKMDNCVISF